MKTHIKKLCDEWYNKGRADADAENEISYDVGYEKGRADAIDEFADYVLDAFAPLYTKEELINLFKEKLKEQNDG